MASVSSYLQGHKIHRRLQFHGYGHPKNSEDGIQSFLKVLENYYGNVPSLKPQERSMMLAAFAHFHLRDDALLFVQELSSFVSQQWLRLFCTRMEKYDRKPEVKLVVPDCKPTKGVAIKAIKPIYGKIPTFDDKLLESEMLELIITTDERTRVLLSVLFMLRNVCHMICMFARLSNRIRSGEDKLKLKRKEQLFVDQSVCKGEQLEKGVDEESEKILEKRGNLAEKSQSKLEKGIMQKSCIVCCSISKKKMCVRRIASASGRPVSARLAPYAWCV